MPEVLNSYTRAGAIACAVFTSLLQAALFQTSSPTTSKFVASFIKKKKKKFRATDLPQIPIARHMMFQRERGSQ